MKYTHLLVPVCIWLTACTPLVISAPEASDELLSGRVLFGEVIDVSDLRTDEIMALNDDLRDYVASIIRLQSCH